MREDRTGLATVVAANTAVTVPAGGRVAGINTSRTAGVTPPGLG